MTITAGLIIKKEKRKKKKEIGARQREWLGGGGEGRGASTDKRAGQIPIAVDKLSIILEFSFFLEMILIVNGC